jgi:predicted lipase
MINSSSLNTENNENYHNIIKKLKEPSEKNYLQRKRKRSENKISKQFENQYQNREKIEQLDKTPGIEEFMNKSLEFLKEQY